MRRRCVCECVFVAPLCSPPTVSSGVSPGSADPPASPRSEGAWSLGSPSSVSPPSQLLWKWTKNIFMLLDKLLQQESSPPLTHFF